jgi:hypothetical protein
MKLWFPQFFESLEYQNYTPLYSERKSINPDNYLTREKMNEWQDIMYRSTKSVLFQAASSFQHACCRMGIEESRTKDQIDFWSSMIVNPNKKLTPDAAYKALFDTGILDTPALQLNPNTGVIRICNAWT